MATVTGQAPITTTLRARIPAEGTAGTGGIYPIGTAPYAGHITRASIMPDTTITGAATNNKDTAIQNRGAAGSGTTVMANRTHANAVNSPQADETALALSGTAANLDVAAGDVLALVSTVNGTGMTLPALIVEVDILRD